MARGEGWLLTFVVWMAAGSMIWGKWDLPFWLYLVVISLPALWFGFRGWNRSSEA